MTFSRAKPAPTYVPRLMQTAEAARYLGISPRKLDTLRERGVIPSKTDGGNRFYDVADLNAYADGLPYDRVGETEPTLLSGGRPKKSLSNVA